MVMGIGDLKAILASHIALCPIHVLPNEISSTAILFPSNRVMTHHLGWALYYCCNGIIIDRCCLTNLCLAALLIWARISLAGYYCSLGQKNLFYRKKLDAAAPRVKRL